MVQSQNVPEKMTVISISEPGGPEVLTPVQVRTPYPGEGQYLVRVAAAGVNRPDILQRMGLYPAPEGVSDIPGLEISGEVVIAGRGTNRFKAGDHICALVSGAGYGEYCLTGEGTTLPVPHGVSIRDAAGLPETFFTVWYNVFERAGLKAGEWLLVHGGASGIGVTAIQLARAFGAKVIVTVGSDEKCRFCESLGADRAINYLKEDFPERVKEITAGHGADVILDMMGGDYIEKNMSAAALDGRIAQIAFLNGAVAEVNFTRLLIKRLTLSGSTLRAQSLEVKSRLASALEQKVWPLFEKTVIKPVTDSVFPLAKAAEAHAYMESRTHMGKILLVNEAFSI